MSDLTATNCGCGCEGPAPVVGGGWSAIIWIMLLLACCGGDRKSVG